MAFNLNLRYLSRIPKLQIWKLKSAKIKGNFYWILKQHCGHAVQIHQASFTHWDIRAMVPLPLKIIGGMRDNELQDWTEKVYIYMYVCVYCIDTHTYVYLTVYINW